MVAGIKITSVFQCHALTAGRPEDADSSCHAKPACQGTIEIENKSLPDIPLDPLVKDLYQKSAPLLRLNGSVRDLVAFLEPAFIVPLYDRNELDVIRLQLEPYVRLRVYR